MKFYIDTVFYSVIRTNDTTSEGAQIFKYTAWDKYGQLVDAGEIAANCAEHVKDMLHQ